MSVNKWQVVIGLEIHAQLQTKTKMFSSDSTQFTSEENTHVNPVSLGFPGTLPLLNEQALALAVKTSRAFRGKIQNISQFARKNYFYPDLPKGYQVSQYDKPFNQGGQVEFYLNDQKVQVFLERIHMEEDAGRSLHKKDKTLVNLNRAGTPLLEIVTQPCIKSPLEAAKCARAIRQILRYIEVCDGNLEEGSLRCDCNISLKKPDSQKLGTKVELKNINSFKFIEKALDYEIKRQTQALDSNQTIAQETRLYDSKKNQTFPMRSKEEASDYRYFPDPDLLPVSLDSFLQNLQPLPELPFEKFERYKKEYQLKPSQIELLIEEKNLADYFEELSQKTKDPEASCLWLLGEMLGHLKTYNLDIAQQPISTDDLSELILLVSKEELSITMAKDVFHTMWEDKKSAKEVVKEKNLRQISDIQELSSIVDKILKENPKQVGHYNEGKTKLFGFFVGQAMKETQGQAHPQKLSTILKQKLKDSFETS